VAQKFKTGISVEELASAATQAIGVKVDGDSEARIKIDAGGKITWGSGSATGDSTLYRSAANILKTDDAFHAVAGVITITTSGTPETTPDDGALAVDNTNSKFYFRSDSSWKEVSSDASTTAADGGSSSSFVRYHINADGGNSTVVAG
jgi:hypothetical protein